MRTIGMIGGMSWESTAEYYRLLNESVRHRLGGFHSARVLIDSLDFAEIESMQSAGDWVMAGRLLADHATRLQHAGADLIVLCTNTMHLVFDQLTAAVTVPVLHIADAAADAVRTRGLTRVGLLGTAFTMEQDFYRDRLAGHGLDVLVPGEVDRVRVHTVIFDELVHGIVRDESRAVYRAVIDELVAAGAEGIVLGCTEIELLVSAEDSAVPVFPTTRIHVDAALDAALRGGGATAS